MTSIVTAFALAPLALLAVSERVLVRPATVAGTATAEAHAASWLAIRVPFRGDDNRNGHTLYEVGPASQGPFSSTGAFHPRLSGSAEWRANVIQVSPGGRTVELATAPGGPWTRVAGSPFESNLPFHPKRARLRGLVPGTDYWIRATIVDPDGVSGNSQQVVGPVRYAGLENLALGKAVSADPGWGCCPSPQELVDGRIQNDAWYFGFAWTGGAAGWSGGAPGFKQATVDLGAPTPFNRAVVWYHDPANVPIVWQFQHSDDRVNWSDDYTNDTPVCRTETEALPGYWGYPACAHDASFPEVTARYFRYLFNDRTLFGGIHGWAVEIEVFHDEGGRPEGAR